MKSTLTLLFSLAVSVCLGQRIEYPSLGLAFSIPGGFYGEETVSGYSMVDNVNYRYLLIKPHGAKNMDAFDQYLDQSRLKIDDYTFYFNTPREHVDDKVFGKAFSAMGDKGYNFNGYAIILMNDQGQGMSVIAMTPQTTPNVSPKNLAMSLYRSVSLSAPVRDEKLEKWTRDLQNKYLIGISSHYFGDSGSEFSSGGDTQSEIWLCGNGTGKYKFKSSWSGSSSTGFTGYSTSANEIYGQWSLFYNLQSKPVLRIMDDKGNVMQFLVYYDGRTLTLNGAKFSASNFTCH